LTVGQVNSLNFFEEKGHGDKEEVNGRKRLERFFTKKQLGLIESAFEQSYSYAEAADCSTEASDRAVDYRKVNNLVNSGDALISIWKNVIKNNGIFKP
jgi:hypothetical protein